MAEPTDVTATVRAEVRAWVDTQWDPELALVTWRQRLVEAGWARPSWPARWGGRDLPAALDGVVAAELAAAGTPPLPEGVGMNLAAPTLLEHGREELKERLVRGTVTGEISWCQLFSEPGAGSDLAGLQTRAVRDPDGGWRVSGQKVWNTSAHHADFGLLVARTDPAAPKHAGLSYFVLPMKQPGVTVRPLRQMNGHASFNEVFLDDARVPESNLVGELGGGWAVALTTLAHERRLSAIAGSEVRPGGDGRAWREYVDEAARARAPYVWYPQRAGRVDLVVPRALATGKAQDPLVRQEVASLMCLALASRWTAQRAAAARALGRPPGPEGSLGKLAASVIARKARQVHVMLDGANGLLAGPDGTLDGLIAEIVLSVPAVSIAGGTDEIQRNILAERVLGLPREPRP